MSSIVKGSKIAAAAIFAAVGFNSGPAMADASTNQEKTTGDSDSLGEIVVSARRRNESIAEVPLSISVISADTIQALGLQSLTDLANYTPGLTFNNADRRGVVSHQGHT